MNFGANIVLKEDYTFLVADRNGQMEGGEQGLYNRDTRLLKRYRWDFGEGYSHLLGVAPDACRYLTHHARMLGEEQEIGIRRTLTVSSAGFEDELVVENTGPEASSCAAALRTEADFTDLFAVRQLFDHVPGPCELVADEEGFSYRYRASDGGVSEVNITFSPAPVSQDGGAVFYRFDLDPGSRAEIRVAVTIRSEFTERRKRGSREEVASPPVPYSRWRASFPETEGPHGYVIRTAVDDLRALLLFTPRGAVPAAGIPWYGALFGRDALITAYMLLHRRPELALGVLRCLSAYQGTQYDGFREEEPGKILHEIRFGELSRTGRTPHHSYYGSIDATPLFLVLLREYVRETGDTAPVLELQEHWEACLTWMKEYGDRDGDGFLEYRSPQGGIGLTVQSWKDSVDSMSHADGTLARGPVAPAEVQGYAYAAYRAAAELCRLSGRMEDSDLWSGEAEDLKRRFNRTFWQADLGVYAMALDGEKHPLRVLSSNAGHLLFTGIAEERVLPALNAALFSPALWSGWGIRTLGTGEKRYNPLSYHNGSVWPHDTALIAGGLRMYGYLQEAARIRDALFDLAESQRDGRLPELVGGYDREADIPPVSYPVACRPQAWDAAALIYLLRQCPVE
jgi:glycogen debranching enzyme